MAVVVCLLWHFKLDTDFSLHQEVSKFYYERRQTQYVRQPLHQESQYYGSTIIQHSSKKNLSLFLDPVDGILID